MHSEPDIETRAAVRGRRRKRGSGPSAAGPVFVDNSGRRSRLLRRIGVLVGVVCLGYAVVLGMAFMGVGISLNPSQLLPFGNNGQGAPAGDQGAGGRQPQSGVAPTGTPPAQPTGTPPAGTATGAPPSGTPTGIPPSAAPSAAPTATPSTAPSAASTATSAAN